MITEIRYIIANFELMNMASEYGTYASIHTDTAYGCGNSWDHYLVAHLMYLM